MTEGSQKRAFPIWALILDVFGTLLVALGIYSVVTGRLPFVADLELGYLGMALIIAGVPLMMPPIIVLVQRSLSRQ